MRAARDSRAARIERRVPSFGRRCRLLGKRVLLCYVNGSRGWVDGAKVGALRASLVRAAGARRVQQ